MDQVRTGGCLCGSVRFKVRGNLRDVVACHCGQCRKQSGLYYAATNAPDEALEITDSGTLTWFSSSDTARRGFCGKCGSALFWKDDSQDSTSIMAGSLDQPTGLRMACHIYVADRGDFYEIGDGLPQYARSRDL